MRGLLLEKERIILIIHGNFEEDILKDIADDISVEFQYPVTIEKSNIDLSLHYDQVRRQYDANGLLKDIDSMAFPGAIKKIGLFRVDLFIPILTYIFGQAALSGNSGVASAYRLKNEQYGMPPDEELFYERMRKVIMHELGHTFGIKHCSVPTCVMRSSTYVEDIDQKSYHFCQQHKLELSERFQ